MLLGFIRSADLACTWYYMLPNRVQSLLVHSCGYPSNHCTATVLLGLLCRLLPLHWGFCTIVLHYYGVLLHTCTHHDIKIQMLTPLNQILMPSLILKNRRWQKNSLFTFILIISRPLPPSAVDMGQTGERGLSPKYAQPWILAHSPSFLISFSLPIHHSPSHLWSLLLFWAAKI